MTPATSDVTRLFDLQQAAVIGDNKVEILFAGSGELAYQVSAVYYLPAGSTVTGQGPLGFTIGYDRTTLKINESISVTATLKNKGTGPVPTVMMRIGLPPGFTVDLDALITKLGGIVKHAELQGPYLVLYLGDLATQLTVSFKMTATLVRPDRRDPQGHRDQLKGVRSTSRAPDIEPTAEPSPWKVDTEQ